MDSLPEEVIYEGGRILPGGTERAPPGGCLYNPETKTWRPIRSEEEIEELRRRQKSKPHGPIHRHEQPQEHTTHKRRYGPGQFIQGGVRAGKGGAELDLETGEIMQFDPNSPVQHLGPGQLMPGGRHAGPGGANIEKSSGRILDEPGGPRQDYIEDERLAREAEEAEEM
ncbi:hypothetical protein RCL1_006716 [Eukaryota sp. TZLM3-RCL]